jgi:hypothetical protein
MEQARKIAAELRTVGDLEYALFGALAIASSSHDAAAVFKIARSAEAAVLRDKPPLHAFLALALYWTCGLHAAAGELWAVCQKQSAGISDRTRRSVCALAALGRFTQGKTLKQLRVTEPSPIQLLGGQVLPVIMASVNGLAPEYFIIDTGAATSVLSKKYCDRNAIEYSTEYSDDAYDPGGNTVSAYPAIVERLEVGPATVTNWTANVIELTPRLRVAGIISPLDTFAGAATELDLRHNTFRVMPGSGFSQWPSALTERIHSAPLFWDDGNVFLRAWLDRAFEGWFLLDSGAAGNFVTPAVARAMGKSFDSEGGFYSVSALGATKVFAGFEAALSVDGSGPRPTRFSIKADSPDKAETLVSLTSAGCLGAPWISGRCLRFDPAGRTLLFTETTAGRALNT